MKFKLYDDEFELSDVAKVSYNEKPGSDILTIKFLDGSEIEKIASGDERAFLKEFKKSLLDAMINP